MALIVKDRVQETSTTTGTGTLTLAGALTGFQTFSSAIGNTNTTYYAIVNDAQFEVGIGTVSAGALSRDTVLESSNGGSLVNFSAGIKTVFCTYPAEKSVYKDETDKVTGYVIENSSIGATTASTGKFTAVTTPSVTATTNDLTLSSISTGAVNLNTARGTGFQVNESFLSGTSANYVYTSGRVAGSGPVLGVAGSDTNTGLFVTSKGTGNLTFTSNNGGTNQFIVSHTASAVNYVQVTGAATGSAPIISAQGSDTNINLTLQSKGTGAINLSTGNGTQFRASQTFVTGTAVNYIDASGRQTGLGPILSTNGSDANVRFNITSKGTEAVGLYTNLANQLQLNVAHTASAVNYVQVTGGATGGFPRITAQGSDTNVPLYLTGKGASDVNIGRYLTIGTDTANNVQIIGAAATVAPRVIVTGSDTNINLSLASKGTGSIQFNTAGGLQAQINDATTTGPYTLLARAATGNSQKITAFGTANLALQSTGGGTISLRTGDETNTQLTIGHTAGAVNNVQITGAATGVAETQGPLLSAQGSDGNINMRYLSKGAGSHYFSTNSTQIQFRIAHSAGAIANRFAVFGSNTGSAPSLVSEGTDTNIDLALTPKGTGLVRFGTYVAGATLATGYINIKAADGTTYKVLVST